MLIPTLVMAVIAIGLLIFAVLKGEGEHISGLEVAGDILLSIAPLLVFAFIVAGLMQVLIPTRTISKWVGHESGLIGTMVAFLTGWSILAVTRLPLEVGLMGWKFTAIRLSVSFFFPIVAGLLANLIVSRTSHPEQAEG
jgi:uncharacterized membrane protein YraQ (UPF0718 family)